MSCAAPFDAFRLATEHLGPELYRRASVQSLWLNFIERSEYMQGVGLTNSTFTIERSEPTNDEESWEAIKTTNTFTGEGQSASGFCGTTWNDVNYGHTELLYSPEQFGLRGPIICQDDLIYNFQAGRFLEAYLFQLSIRSQRSIENRYQNIYMHLVPKNSANSAYTQVSTGGAMDADHTPPNSPDMSGFAGANLPTSQLTQDMLDKTAAELNLSGASNPNSPDWISYGPDGPLYPLLIGQEASQAIVLNNAEFRNDWRYADMGSGPNSMVLKRMGATRVIKNYRHVPTLTPPRWKDSGGGVLVRVPAYIMPAKSKGFGAEVNPAYLDAANAKYEGAIVLNPWVFHDEIIRPVNAAAGLSWMPKSYFGEWMFQTGGKEIDEAACYDPLKKLGRHFAEFKHASRPIFPQFGRLIVFKRCPVTSFSLVTCT
jgi:hypothetical protein